MGVGEFALGLILELLGAAMEGSIKFATLPFFQQRKIRRRVEDATAEVVEPLLPFLENEGIKEDKQRRLILTCVQELRPFTEKPELLFQGSLAGQKIFDDLYADRDLPLVIIEDGLSDVYALLFPRIATLLCKIPAAVKDWENEAWTENFRRLDDLVAQLRGVFVRVDEIVSQPSREADESLTSARRSLAQKIGFELDLTGLRADRPLMGKFDDFFVHPKLAQKDVVIRESGNKSVMGIRSVETPDESFGCFTAYSYRAIVVGAPGAGKSTWSKWLQRGLLTSRWDGITVRVELRRFSGESLSSLHALIREAAGRHLAEELTTERIARWLDAHKVVLILDGFDEIRPADRDAVYEWILELEIAARNCPIVLTSRPLTTDHLDRLKSGREYWTMEPFDRRRVVDYIQRWYKFTPLLEGGREVDAETLAGQWGSDPTIGPLTGNPLLLSTLLMVHHLDGSLPSGRSQLYRRYVQGMLGLWDDRRQVAAAAVQLTLEQKRQILRSFALHLFLLEQEQIDETEASAWLEGALQRMGVPTPALDVLAVLRERSGLIVGPGVYSFAHKSIGEYLVAETILEGDKWDDTGRRMDRFRLFENRDNDRWNTVTFLWAGLAPVADVELFVNECIDVKNWQLAGGILYDQYERMPVELRRALLLKLLSPSCTPNRDSGHDRYSKWIPSGPAHPESDDLLPAAVYGLRSLSQRDEIDQLIEKAISDRTLTWEDRVTFGPDVRDLFWMYFITEPEFVYSKLYLVEPCPKVGSPEYWAFWALERLLAKALILDAEEFRSLVLACREASSYFRGNVPLALLCVALALPLENKAGSALERKFTKLFEVLPDSLEQGFPTPEFLEGTEGWIHSSLGPMEEVIDLLSEFIKQMEALITQGVIKRDDVYEKAINFVRELRERRERISALRS